MTVTLTLVALDYSTYARRKQSVAEGEAMLKHALELSDVRCKDCPPFFLRAKFRLFQKPGGPPLDGTFEEHWQAPDRWRTAIQLQGSSQIRIGAGNRVWSYGDWEYEPYPLRALIKMLGAGEYPEARQHAEVNKTVEQQIGGVRSPCVQIGQGRDSRRTLCFDERSQTLLTEEIRLPGTYESIEYSDYSPFHGKVFPRLLRYALAGNPLLEVQVSDLVPEPAAAPYLFEPPAGALSWPTCSGMKHPEPLEKPEPRYSEQARKRRAQGRVVMYMVIGVDGRVHNPSLLSKADPELTQVAKDTITQRWRFRPALCGNMPVPSTVIVEITFRVF